MQQIVAIDDLMEQCGRVNSRKPRLNGSFLESERRFWSPLKIVGEYNRRKNYTISDWLLRSRSYKGADVIGV
jgi:hypothetical protein